MRILFLTTNDFGFGGSELLWAKTAIWMAKHGHHVGASVKNWSPAPALLKELEESPVEIFWHSHPASEADFQAVVDFYPDLVCVSTGYHLEGLDWIERLSNAGLPFAIVFHAVHELGFMSLNERNSLRYAKAHAASKWLYFVSAGNRSLYERMLGTTTTGNSSIVRNPYSVPYTPSCSETWPAEDLLRLATVGRIECYHKGYDLLIEALGKGKWANRPFELNVYGDGPHLGLLDRLWRKFGLPSEKLKLHGHITDIEKIWGRNHILVQPSRLEGLPISVVEAMLCARPIIATAVAGHTEVIENGASGFIAQAPTVQFVQEALEVAWSKRRSLQKYGRRSRTIAEAIIPRNAEHEFASSLSSLAAGNCASTSFAYPISPEAQSSHGHAFLRHDIPEKIDLPFDRDSTATVVLHNCRGTVRFDPATHPGLIRIVAVAATGENGVEISVTESKLSSILSVKGTAKRISSLKPEFWIESTGEDPMLLIDGEVLAGSSPYSLRLIVHVY